MYRLSPSGEAVADSFEFAALLEADAEAVPFVVGVAGDTEGVMVLVPLAFAECSLVGLSVSFDSEESVSGARLRGFPAMGESDTSAASAAARAAAPLATTGLEREEEEEDEDAELRCWKRSSRWKMIFSICVSVALAVVWFAWLVLRRYML